MNHTIGCNTIIYKRYQERVTVIKESWGVSISAFVFATRIVQFLFYLNPKFKAYSSFLCLYRPVGVGPVRKPHCWFSHEAAQIYRNGSLQEWPLKIIVLQVRSTWCLSTVIMT